MDFKVRRRYGHFGFIVQPSKFCLVIFGANFAVLFVLYQ